MQPDLLIFSREEYPKKLGQRIELEAKKAIDSHGRFTVGLSGGSLVNYLCEGLPNIKTDWSKWLFFFCDERIVAETSEDSISGAYKRRLCSEIPSLTTSQFVTIKYGISTAEAAVDYGKKLIEYFKTELPIFDLLLLGMGPDGHTCSLFPGHPLLNETSLTVAPIFDSPKPPPERITLTLPVLNAASVCMFTVTGEDKAETLTKAMAASDLPASKVRPTNGQLIWVLDSGAAKNL